jgi:hypothetical protein
MEVAMNCKNKTKSSPVLYLRTIQFSCLRKISLLQCVERKLILNIYCRLFRRAFAFPAAIPVLIKYMCY